jgi:hypothetical protein
MDRNKERINYSYGSSGLSGSSGSTSFFDGGLGNGGGRYKAKIKALGMGLAI